MKSADTTFEDYGLVTVVEAKLVYPCDIFMPVDLIRRIRDLPVLLGQMTLSSLTLELHLIATCIAFVHDAILTDQFIWAHHTYMRVSNIGGRLLESIRIHHF